MKLPFYLRKNKLRQDSDGKLWMDIRMNKFDRFCLTVVMLWRKIK